MDAEDAAEELRAALTDAGFHLPGVGVDPRVWDAPTIGIVRLVELGSALPDVAHRLAATVRKGAARVPEVVVRDRASDRIGVVMGNVGPYVQLRPLSGGREWDVHPDDVRELTAPEVLSARVAEANRISARRHP